MDSFYVALTHSAEKDLREIAMLAKDYFQLPDSYRRYMENIEHRILSLEHFPLSKRICGTNRYSGAEFRLLKIGNFIAIYTVDHPNLRVNVMRIVYSKRDIELLIAKLCAEQLR